MMEIIAWIDSYAFLIVIVATIILLIAMLAEISVRRIYREMVARRFAEQELRNHTKELDKIRKELQKEKDKLDAVISSMGEGLLVCDDKHKCVLVNQMASSMLRTTPSDMIGKNIKKYVDFYSEREGSQDAYSGMLNRAIKDTDIIDVMNMDKYYCRVPEQDPFPVSMVIAPMVKSGRGIGAITLFRDSTREREVDRMKTEFVSVASHQLRTPLTGINWNLEMLMQGDLGEINTQQKESIKEAYKGSQHMVNLVNTLLNMSRIETGRLKVETKPTDLAILIKEVISECKLLTGGKQCKILFKKPGQLLKKVSVDPILLREVISNFITNAIRYSPRGKKCSIVVNLSKNKNGYLVSVKDQGIGIATEDQKNIFNKFFRTKEAIKMETEGSGLGLYMCKMVMDEAGGKVWFESKEGRGSTFYVQVPLKGMKSKKGEKTLN